MPTLRRARKGSRGRKLKLETTRIELLRKIDEGKEAEIHETNVLFPGRGGNEHRARMIAKIFFDKKVAPEHRIHQPNLYNPIKQIGMISFLQEASRTHHLGLRIPNNHLITTINGRKTILRTRLPPLELLTNSQSQQARADQERQLENLRSIGVYAHADAFRWQIDPKTGEGVATLYDFGQVHFYPKPKRK